MGHWWYGWKEHCEERNLQKVLTLILIAIKKKCIAMRLGVIYDSQPTNTTGGDKKVKWTIRILSHSIQNVRTVNKIKRKKAWQHFLSSGTISLLEAMQYVWFIGKAIDYKIWLTFDNTILVSEKIHLSHTDVWRRYVLKSHLLRFPWETSRLPMCRRILSTLWQICHRCVRGYWQPSGKFFVKCHRV